MNSTMQSAVDCGVAQHPSPAPCVYNRRNRHGRKTEGAGRNHSFDISNSNPTCSATFS